MRLITVISLSLLLFIGITGKWTIYAAYELNKAYISSVLCENKEVPAMNCQGKCYLKKQLTADTQPSNPAPSANLRLPEIQPLFNEIQFFDLIFTMSENHYFITSDPKIKGRMPQPEIQPPAC